MTEDDLFDFFVDERVSQLIDKITPREEHSNSRVLSEEEIFIQKLSEKQQKLIEKYIQVFIDSCASQEKYLYKSGFLDGIKIMRKINEL